MHLRLIAMGTRMPAWVQDGCSEYLRRLPREWRFRIQEIPLQQRKPKDTKRLVENEGRRMLAAIPPAARAIAMDSRGVQWSTRELAGQMASWLQQGVDLAFLIGGPEGLPPPCSERAEVHWSLSRLTFPHPLVRILVLEQLYRAWSLLQGHPYHR